MRNLIALAVLGLALATFGCAGPQARADKPISKKTMIKCPRCGVEFPVGEGLSEMEKGR